LPAKIVEDYHKLQKADPSRPVLLNLGQGVARDKSVGRGTRTNHPEDYPEYVKGCDKAREPLADGGLRISYPGRVAPGRSAA